MGQDGSRPAVANASSSSGGGVAPSVDAQLQAELDRMIHFNAGGGGGSPAGGTVLPYQARAAALAARAQALPPPRAPFIASATEAFLLNRHERTVEEAVRRTMLFLAQPTPPTIPLDDKEARVVAIATAPCTPQHADIHRALAAVQTIAMQASTEYGSSLDLSAETSKTVAFNAQLAKSTVTRVGKDIGLASAAVKLQVDALLFDVHGQAFAPDPGDTPGGLTSLALSVFALAEEVHELLSPEEREAVRILAAA